MDVGGGAFRLRSPIKTDHWDDFASTAGGNAEPDNISNIRPIDLTTARSDELSQSEVTPSDIQEQGINGNRSRLKNCKLKNREVLILTILLNNQKSHQLIDIENRLNGLLI